LVAALRNAPNTSQVSSYWTAPPSQADQLISRDTRSALVVARVAGDDSTAPQRVADITRPLAGTHDGVTVRGGGAGNILSQADDQTKKDLATAEMISVPLTTLALIWVFGSVIASLLPLVVGLMSIVGAMAVLRGLASFTSVSIYGLNMTTALGLA